jgi:hypothetical protein
MGRRVRDRMVVRFISKLPIEIGRWKTALKRFQEITNYFI